MSKKIKFIKKAFEKYNDQYDYSLVDYIDSEIKIKIICKKHNLIFEQSPASHLRGRNGCELCVNRINNIDSFISQSNKTHFNKYDYSNSIYKDSKTKIIIICPEHGEFKQLPNNHFSGQGCPKCKGLSITNKKTLTNEEFINKAIKKHGDKYDYSLVKYINSKEKIKIICKTHGEFNQQAVSHLRGKGCPECAIENTKKVLTKTLEEFIIDAKKTHGEKYDYSLVNYVNSITKVKIICPEHGEFEQVPYDHISNHGCVNCTTSVSSQENEINKFLLSIGLTTIQSSTSIIKPLQLDIFIPSHKLGIEYNGLYWHNETKLDSDYHLNKTSECESKGIQLIHIFEDEWLNKQDVVKSRLKNILGLTDNRIFARKCLIKNVTPGDTKIFLNNTHLQGYSNSSIRLGLYYNDELVSLMIFNKPRLGIGINQDGYELTRFSNKLDTIVIGGADKLLKYFIKTFSPKKIISYADRRWSQGGLYDKLGFKVIRINKPNYWYVVGKNRRHRLNYRKSELKKLGFDTKNNTEHKIMFDRGIYRIYDCGTITYEMVI